MNEKIHDLAILYLSKQDISSLTPQQLYEQYEAVHNELKEYAKCKKSDGITILK